MKLKKETLQELAIILKEEYSIEVNPSDLEKIAYTLLRYFSLLLKLQGKERF